MKAMTDSNMKNIYGGLLLIGLAAGIGMAPSPAAAIDTIAREALLIDADTGAVLFDKDAQRPMHPASMSKMMTAHMVFERIRDGRLSMDDTFIVSENAWRKGGAKSGGSTMFLNIGQRVRVEDLLKGIIIQSGNDACIVIAEGLSGSEEAFADEMNKRAKEMGLKNSTFRNSTGLPDPEHLMSPYDLALLAKDTINAFPEYYHLYSDKNFTYNGIKQGNRNPLLYRDTKVDGLKTGHTEESGYGLTASAARDGRRLILVMNGLPNMKARSSEPEKMLEWAFTEFKNYPLFKKGETVANADVWLGEGASVPLVIDKDVVITLPRKARKDLKVVASFNGPVPAPVAAGSRLGMLSVTAPGIDPINVPLLAGGSVEGLGTMGRLSEAIKYILWGKSS
jgi:D-alanyl-D-alanine carboxypeptidase (penicillin-binding protein 5/6)